MTNQQRHLIQRGLKLLRDGFKTQPMTQTARNEAINATFAAEAAFEELEANHARMEQIIFAIQQRNCIATGACEMPKSDI